MSMTSPRLVIALVAALGVTAGAQQNNEEFARRQFDSGMNFLQNHRNSEAMKDLQAVVDSFASSSVADNALLQIAQYQLETAHDLEQSQGAVDKLLKEYPDTDSAPMAHVLAGRIAMTKGRAAADLDVGEVDEAHGVVPLGVSAGTRSTWPGSSRRGSRMPLARAIGRQSAAWR